MRFLTGWWEAQWIRFVKVYTAAPVNQAKAFSFYFIKLHPLICGDTVTPIKFIGLEKALIPIAFQGLCLEKKGLKSWMRKKTIQFYNLAILLLKKKCISLYNLQNGKGVAQYDTVLIFFRAQIWIRLWKVILYPHSPDRDFTELSTLESEKNT